MTQHRYLEQQWVRSINLCTYTDRYNLIIINVYIQMKMESRLINHWAPYKWAFSECVAVPPDGVLEMPHQVLDLGLLWTASPDAAQPEAWMQLLWQQVLLLPEYQYKHKINVTFSYSSYFYNKASNCTNLSLPSTLQDTDSPCHYITWKKKTSRSKQEKLSKIIYVIRTIIIIHKIYHQAYSTHRKKCWGIIISIWIAER